MRLKSLLTSLEQPPLRLVGADLSRPAPIYRPSAAPTDDFEITGLAYDSRQIQAGGLFIAVPGFHTDGQRFLADAAQRGALVALGEALPPEAQSSLPLPY